MAQKVPDTKIQILFIKIITFFYYNQLHNLITSRNNNLYLEYINWKK